MPGTWPVWNVRAVSMAAVRLLVFEIFIRVRPLLPFLFGAIYYFLYFIPRRFSHIIREKIDYIYNIGLSARKINSVRTLFYK